MPDTISVIGGLLALDQRLVRAAAARTEHAESPAVWRTLGVLRDHGPIRLGELARLSRVSQPTMTKVVQSLRERGWVGRVVDDSDLRAVLLAAEPSGLDALDAWRTQAATTVAPYFADVRADDIAALARIVEVVRGRLDAAYDADSSVQPEASNETEVHA